MGFNPLRGNPVDLRPGLEGIGGPNQVSIPYGAIRWIYSSSSVILRGDDASFNPLRGNPVDLRSKRLGVPSQARVSIPYGAIRWIYELEFALGEDIECGFNPLRGNPVDLLGGGLRGKVTLTVFQSPTGQSGGSTQTRGPGG